ncbi:YMGG-like glycine zipper-containing protein [Antarctobacter sp.]|uniref:YMGG-like glycine zipper-containing protein n=1 Tax=Antarctobacter sp. TaxID=1872577 RepID=UPI002B272CF7|nr:YMGG-like glycine zipper-containing protein [Antarctobacter sp.]
MKPTSLFLIAPLTFVTACTAPMDRDYTLDGPRNAMFDTDLASCKVAAANYRPDAHLDGALTGAATGAVFGALDNEDDRGTGAVAGAAVGALAGIAAAEDELSEDRREVVIRCLQNRGHRVIG